MTLRLSLLPRFLFILTGLSLALGLYSCDLLNAKQFSIRVTNSNGDFTGFYSKNGESAKSFGGTSINGTAYDYSKDLDFESVEVQATYTGTATSFMKITVFEDGAPLSSASRCSENFTLTMEYTPDDDGSTTTDSSDSSGDDTTDGKTSITNATSSEDCDTTTSDSNDPDAPEGLELESAGTTSVTVTIDDPNDSEITQYNIYFSTGGGTPVAQEKLESVWDTDTDGKIIMTLTSLTTATEYDIYVTAVSSSESAVSSTETVTTD